MRFQTLQQIDDAGFDVRLWCFECARGSTVDGIIWMWFEHRGLAMDIDAVRPFFPCRQCGSRDALILPASAPHRRQATGKDLVVAYFHTQRGAGKKAKR